MSLIAPNIIVVTQYISYAAWKIKAVGAKVRYVSIPLISGYIAAFGKLGITLTTKIQASSDVTDFTNTILPTATQAVDEIELAELCRSDSTIGVLDGRQQKAYDITDTYIYIGYATVGISQSATGWTIKKLELDSSGNPTSEKWTAVEAATWTNRASETYS